MSKKLVIDVLVSSFDPIGSELTMRKGVNFEYEGVTYGSIQQAIDVLTNPLYPKRLIGEKYISKTDLELIPGGTMRIPDYWEKIEEITEARIMSDTWLLSEIQKLPIGTMYITKVNGRLLNKRYCEILTKLTQKIIRPKP